MFESKLRKVSIGIAAENKELGQHELAIIPIEMVPVLDGELLDSITEYEVSGTDGKDQEYTVKVNASNALTATWLPWGSNRVTSPDVRRGERLLVWKYADADKYYWTPMGMDDDLRRLETVIYAWSATPEENAELDLGSNMYTMEISTHGKHLTLHTTTADGEPFEYSMQLNTKDGVFFLSDDVGNTITLNSKDTVITAINKDETEVTLDKTKLYGYAKDDITTESDGTHNSTSVKDFTVETQANLHVTAAEMINIESGMDMNLKSGANLTAEIAGNATINTGGGITGTAGGPITITAGGPIAITNGAAGITMNGPTVELN